jgi:tetratricopeptide (TPR) repeat protein
MKRSREGTERSPIGGTRLLAPLAAAVMVLLFLGTALAQNDTSSSQARLQQALKLDPTDESANLALAEVYFGKKQCSLAMPHYAKAGRHLRQSPEAVVHYAQCEVDQGGASRALPVLALLAPRDGEHHFAAGEMLVQHQAYAAAAAEFGQARLTYQDPYAAGYNQALAYFKAGDYAKTIDTANELLNQGHRTAELANLAGNAYLKNHQLKEAYNALRLATGLDPKNEDSYIDLCSISLDFDNYDLGIEIANLGLSHLPDSMRLFLQRGVLRAMKGEFDAAQQDFAAAARLAPNDVSPQVSQGVLAMQMGHLDQSVDLLRRATTLSPGNYLAQYWFAEALLRSGAAPNGKDGDEALVALQTSVTSNAGFWHSQADLGKVLLERGNVDQAISHLEKAAALNPAATSPLYLLAQAYRRKGDNDRAQQLIAQVSKMQAEDREDLARSDLRRIVVEGTTPQ